MRSLTLTGVAILMGMLLTGCGSEDSPTAPLTPSLTVEDAGHNAADHFTTSEPVEFQIDSPCNGELIDISGVQWTQVTFVGTRAALDAGNSVHSELQSSVTGTGIGQVTGATYTIRDVFHESFNSPSPPAPQFTASFRETFRVTSSTTGLSFVIRGLVHVLATPPTGFKVTQDMQSATCVG